MAARLRYLSSTWTTLKLLISRDLKVKYAESVLGYLWSVLEPMLMAMVYWFVFTKIFVRKGGAEPYILFLLLGLLPWFWAQGVIGESCRSLSAEALLVRSTNLTRQIWVIRTVGSKFMEFVLSTPVIIVIALVYFDRVRVSGYIFALPLAIVLQFTLLTGIGLILAPVSVLFRDMERLVRVVLRMLLYLSPVLYGINNIPKAVRPYAGLNPLAGIFDLYRAVFFPDQFAGWHSVEVSAVISVVILVIGWKVFARLENPVLKEI